MQISKEMLEKFKLIYEKRFGEKLSDAEALKQATSLLGLMRVIYRPLPKNEEGK
ncbi:MAG: hypothetical protein ABII02_03475 [Candidatus Magasanikbacteria bacterium]